MDTLGVVLRSIRTPAWGASIDLKDAYLHIPIRPCHRKFLQLQYQDVRYEFAALPFGLSTAPRVFTRIVKTIGAYLRRRGFTIFMYLDDWIIVAPLRDLAAEALRHTWELAASLGFIINEDKSRPIPSQFPTFLGASLDLRRGLAYPTKERVTNLHQCVCLFLPRQAAPARAWLRLLGLMASMTDIVPSCRLRMRPIQLHLLACYRPKFDDIDMPVPIVDWLKPHLRWWTNQANLLKGQPFRPPKPIVTIATDASLSGWGATFRLHHVAGRWNAQQRSNHINVLEMLAVINALQRFQSLIANRAVCVHCDNSTVVAYINQQGGTRSPQLCALTWKLLHWCMDHEISLSAVHVPGEENVLPDALSRGWITPTEWTLNTRVVQSLFRFIDRPHVDLFAARNNHQLPIYCARTYDPHAWQIDALTFRWDGLLAYAFPPISLIERVLTKLEQENCKVLLIAPFWPRQPWFGRLVQLLVHRPVILPKRADILFQPTSGLLHPAPESLHLTCWVLSRCPSAQRDFRAELRTSRHTADELRPERSIIADYAIFTSGVEPGIFIPPILL